MPSPIKLNTAARWVSRAVFVLVALASLWFAPWPIAVILVVHHLALASLHGALVKQQGVNVAIQVALAQQRDVNQAVNDWCAALETRAQSLENECMRLEANMRQVSGARLH